MNSVVLQYRKLVDRLRQFTGRAMKWLSRLWFIGTVFRCQPKYLAGALYEFTHGLVFATMPFWLGGIVLAAQGKLPDPAPTSELNFWIDTWWQRTVSTFKGGELLVFAISLLTPTLWLATHEPDGAQKLPHRRPMLTIAIVVIIIGAVLFALLKAGGSGINSSYIFGFSVALTIGAFVVRYLSLVYHIFRLPPVSENELRKPTEDWLSAVETHRRASS